MGKLISLLIDRSHQRALGLLLWLGAFLVTLIAATFFGSFQVHQTMMDEAKMALAPQIQLRKNIASTVIEMQRRVTADPCSGLFHAQLREISYLPDGLNEFLYAPAGVARCSVNADFAPVSLGTPDAASDEFDIKIWYDRSLDFLGRPGLTGNVVLFGDLAVIVPPQPDPIMRTPWISYEIIAEVPTTGAFWHRNGSPGLHLRAKEAGAMAAYVPAADGAFYASSCVPDGGTCVAMTARLTDVVAASASEIALAIAICAIVALGISGQLHNWLRNLWSFEARFRRHFVAENIVCTYQPILSVETGRIHGCEVLVRWRDVDGSIVFPDQFLPIVAKHGLSRQLTQMVADRAFAELSERAPPHLRLQVNFNISPSDLDAIWLQGVYGAFEQQPDRFRVVVEIVESDELEIERAAREIEALRRYGIRTQLDDFGTGYSNIQKLACLPLDGVKLDRSFAMAEDDALMHRMMLSTIEMIHAAGHRLTVEGVENEDRLRQLSATGHVQFVQGYHISRPLDIDRFTQFLSEQTVADRPRLVA